MSEPFEPSLTDKVEQIMSEITKSGSIQNLAKALAAAQGEMPTVPFDSSNPFYKSRYASLGSVISVSRPVLQKYELAICQMPVSKNGFVGINTMLMHASGEYISECLLLPLEPELNREGKPSCSIAQTAGKNLTYLRRYAWASFCGLYADEDTDGNGHEPTHQQPQQNRPPMQQQQRPAQQNSQPAQQSRELPPRTIPARTAPIGTVATRNWMIQELAGVEQVAEGYFLSKGMLTDTEDLSQLPLEFVPTNRTAMRELRAIVDKLAGNITSRTDTVPGVTVPGVQEPTMAEPAEVAAEPAPEEAWRAVPLPFPGRGGQFPKGTPLGNIKDTKYLFGLWKNFVAEKEFQGRPLTPPQIEANEQFRTTLNQMGQHYNFK